VVHNHRSRRAAGVRAGRGGWGKSVPPADTFQIFQVSGEDEVVQRAGGISKCWGERAGQMDVVQLQQPFRNPVAEVL
jgi:hypothetical protein